MRGAERDSLQWLGIAVLAGALACAYLWLTAGVAGALFGAGWPHIGVRALPGVLWHWLSDPRSPAGGFPRSARARLPGAAGMYGALALVSALVGCAIYALGHGRAGGALHRLLAAVREALSAEANEARAGARWARPRELHALAVRAPQQGRLILGRAGARLIATEAGHSLLVVGPTRSGKTSALAIPALLEWSGPALVTSVKRDLLDVTAGARAAQGRVWVYDPTPGAPTPSCQWNPLEHCVTWQGAWRMARWLVAASQAAPGRNDEARFWSRVAEKLMAPLFYAAAANGRSMADVMHWLDTRESEEVWGCLASTGSQLALDAWQASQERDERTLSSAYTTAEAILSPYESPEVLQTTIGEGLTGARLLEDAGGSAYICAPAHEQERLAPLFAALVREVIAAAYDRYARSGAPLSPPLLVLLDEAGNIAPVPDLAKLAATGAGVGVQIVSVWHDLSQLHGVYGAEQGETVLNNHLAKLVLGGVSDERTLRWVEGTLGREPVRRLSRTAGRREQTRTESTDWQPLAPAPLTRQQRPGEGLLIYGTHPPARVRLRPYYAERYLRAAARGGGVPRSRPRARRGAARRLPGARSA